MNYMREILKIILILMLLIRLASPFEKAINVTLFGNFTFESHEIQTLEM
jgi:hypothetical protein